MSKPWRPHGVENIWELAEDPAAGWEIVENNDNRFTLKYRGTYQGDFPTFELAYQAFMRKVQR